MNQTQLDDSLAHLRRPSNREKLSEPQIRRMEKAQDEEPPLPSPNDAEPSSLAADVDVGGGERDSGGEEGEAAGVKKDPVWFLKDERDKPGLMHTMANRDTWFMYTMLSCRPRSMPPPPPFLCAPTRLLSCQVFFDDLMYHPIMLGPLNAIQPSCCRDLTSKNTSSCMKFALPLLSSKQNIEVRGNSL